MINRRKKTSEERLREYIREEITKSYVIPLKEMDSSIFDGSTFKAAFVDPIGDIYRVIVGRAKEIAYGIKQLTRVALEGTIEMLTFGILEAEFDEINRDYARDLSKVKSEYSEAVGKGWKALLKSDLFFAGMLFNPGAAILIKSLKEDVSRSPREAAKPQSIFADPLVVDAKAVEKTRMTIESYFDNIKKSIKNVMAAADVSQLHSNPQALQQLNKQLRAVEEDSKEVVEEEALEAVKMKVITRVVKMLKDERSKIVQMMQQAGLPASEINDIDGLPAKYEREIYEIARIGGISGQI
jgi:hypothetical protein